MRSKWLSVVALSAYFFCFQWLHLWTDPRKAACILIAYVGLASVLNMLFRTAIFCKYICPMGQFNFITSMLAPLEVRVRNTSTCATCETQACIRGNEVQAGCEMQLFLPKKIGNLDCTFCMNCVKACPNDNVHVALHRPVRDLIEDPARASFQRLSRRPDFAMLALIGIAASITVAAAATSAGQAVLRGLAQHEVLLGSVAIAVLICSGALIAWTGASEQTRRFWTGSPGSAIFCRFTLALLPIGTAMWVAQLVIPFPAAVATTLPIFKGIAAIVTPVKVAAAPLILSAGLLTSLYAGVKTLRRLSLSKMRTFSGAAAWCLGSSSLYGVCIWILGQPRA
jgi:polyferredoxin